MVGHETSPKAIFGTSGIGRDQCRGLAHTPVSAQRRAGYPMSFGALSILLLVMAAGLAVGQLRGGDLDGLRAVHIKALPLAVAALVLQVLLGLQGLRLDGASRMIGSMLLIASLLLGLVVVWANRHLPGMLLIGLGLVANLLVVGINGGMPVSRATLEWAGISATSPDPGQLGPKYVLERPGTRLGVLGARLAIPPGRTMVSGGEVTQYAGLVILIQGLMLAGTRRRLEAFPARKVAGLGRDAPASRNGSAAAPVDDQPSAETGLPVSAGSKAMLLRVAWLAILLGLLLQLALLLAAAGFGIFAGLRPLVAETARNLGWSVLVCTGVAVGRVAAKGRPPLMGIAGLLAAPLALTIANTIQKGIAAALNLPEGAGTASLWVLVLKAAEYGCLAAALGWIGRRAWAGALAYGAAGLLAGIIFGGAALVVAQSAATPLPTAALMVKAVNELVFPVGCALVIFAAEVLGKRVSARRLQQPPSVPFAKTA
jgi:Family of unknown function (DUF5317)